MNKHQQKATDMELARHDEAEGVRLAQVKYTEDRDLANQLLGQSQAFEAIEKTAAVARLMKLKYVKEHKLYRTIKSGAGAPLSWKEYCSIAGESRRSIDEQLNFLDVLGEQALTSLSQMGVSRRELRKLRKLPEEDRQIVIESEAIDTGDKEAIQELLEDIITKHAKEKELASQREETLRKSLDAASEISSKKNVQIDNLAKENALLKGDIQEGEDSPTVQAIKANGMQTAGSIILLRNQADRLAQKGGEADVYEVAALSGALENLRIELALAFERLEAACPAYQAHLEGAAVDMNSWKSGVDIPTDMKL